MKDELLYGLYLNTKLQILSFAYKDTPIRVSDAYLYAWDNSVYPAYSHADWHRPFGKLFKVSEGEVNELSKFLDECWMDKKEITFYQVEDKFLRFENQSTWERWKLIVACRYLYLENLFDKSFWKGLLKPMQHPCEAGSLTRNFDRSSEIYFE